MGTRRGRSVQLVKIERDWGEIYEATTQQTVHKAIWDEIHRIFLSSRTSSNLPMQPKRWLQVHIFLANSKESTRGKVWLSRRVWLGSMRTPIRMCMDTPDSAKVISCNDCLNTGMGETMETSKKRHLVINVWSSFWTLQSRVSITNHLPLSFPQNKPLTT